MQLNKDCRLTKLSLLQKTLKSSKLFIYVILILKVSAFSKNQEFAAQIETMGFWAKFFVRPTGLRHYAGYEN